MNYVYEGQTLVLPCVMSYQQFIISFYSLKLLLMMKLLMNQ